VGGKDEFYDPDVAALPEPSRNFDGIPQFYQQSGNCWFTSMCWNTFGNPALCDFVSQFLPDDLRNLSRSCLHRRDDAEAVRKYCWDKWKLGDDYTKPPWMDGQNGFNEFALLCAANGIPLVQYESRGNRLKRASQFLNNHHGTRFVSASPRRSETHLLALKYMDGDHTAFKPKRSFRLSGCGAYRLCCVYMGSSVCGHQIGMVQVDQERDIWVVGDADCQKDGIGPLFFSLRGNADFLWDAKFVIPITKYGPGNCKKCYINPVNVDGSGTRKTNCNNDYLYLWTGV
jgi:hypothetical protein